jgi:hypothetical protein
MDIHTTDRLIPEPGLAEVIISIGTLKTCKSPATYQIPSGLFKAGGVILYSKIRRLIFRVWNKRNYHSSGRNLLFLQFIKRLITLISIIIDESPSYQQPTKFYQTFFCPV